MRVVNNELCKYCVFIFGGVGEGPKTISLQTVLFSVRFTLYESCMLYKILSWGLPTKQQNIQFARIFMFFYRNAFQSHPTVINRAIKFEQEIKTLDISLFKITNFNSSTA